MAKWLQIQFLITLQTFLRLCWNQICHPFEYCSDEECNLDCFFHFLIGFNPKPLAERQAFFSICSRCFFKPFLIFFCFVELPRAISRHLTFIYRCRTQASSHLCQVSIPLLHFSFRFLKQWNTRSLPVSPLALKTATIHPLCSERIACAVTESDCD